MRLRLKLLWWYLKNPKWRDSSQKTCIGCYMHCPQAREYADNAHVIPKYRFYNYKRQK